MVMGYKNLESYHQNGEVELYHLLYRLKLGHLISNIVFRSCTELQTKLIGRKMAQLNFLITRIRNFKLFCTIYILKFPNRTKVKDDTNILISFREAEIKKKFAISKHK